MEGQTDVAMMSALLREAQNERDHWKAEVERLRAASKQNAVQASRADRRADRLEARAEAAEAEVERLRLLSRRHQERAEAAHDSSYLSQRRAEAAEAVLDAVRALADYGPVYEGESETDPYVVRLEDLRAVLAEGTLASPTSQTTGGGCSDAPAERPHPKCHDDRCAGMPPCLSCDEQGNGPWVADAPAEQRAEGCGYDVGDPPEACRCLLPRGHSGLHSCKHTERAEGGSALGQLQAEAYRAGECGYLIEEDVQVATASAQPPRPSKWVADLCGLPRGHAGEHVGRTSLSAEGDGRG